MVAFDAGCCNQANEARSRVAVLPLPRRSVFVGQQRIPSWEILALDTGRQWRHGNSIVVFGTTLARPSAHLLRRKSTEVTKRRRHNCELAGRSDAGAALDGTRAGS